MRHTKRTDARREWKNSKWKHYRKCSHWTTTDTLNQCIGWSSKWNAKRDKKTKRTDDEIRKLHDIKLNLISTWSLIDYYHSIFMCDRTFPSLVFSSSASSSAYIKSLCTFLSLNTNERKENFYCRYHICINTINEFDRSMPSFPPFPHTHLIKWTHTLAHSFLFHMFFPSEIVHFLSSEISSDFWHFVRAFLWTKGRDLNHCSLHH